MSQASVPATLKDLPSVDELLRTAGGRTITSAAGPGHAADIARAVIGGLRSGLQAGGPAAASEVGLLTAAEKLLTERWEQEQGTSVRRVINASGVIIHTNLGRAPLSDAARRAIVDEAAGYCTLEYDLQSGKRGRRGRRAEELLIELTGAEDALIVNNCAAAAFFVLSAFASGGEVIISRGEMVEIGGDFRVPDVLSQSGGKLREIGTTNRTKLSDYEKAVTDQTRMILRVHPSNYRIVGFTETPALADLVTLAHTGGLMIYEDIGSGALTDLSDTGLKGEPMVCASIAAGVDVVTFSGDKLLGGPQAGIVAGKGEVIARLRCHPLYRALRPDKLIYAALEATLGTYLRGSERNDVPVQRMLSMTLDEITLRVEGFAARLSEQTANTGLTFEVFDGVSAVGGGAAPHFQPPTRLLAITHQTLSASSIEHRLRASEPPVISRIVNDRVVLDLRTVPESEEAQLLNAIASI